MKKINLYLASVVAAATFSLTSCVDPCKDVVCENGGTCIEGTCDCATGYEGDNCADEMRAKFVGSYSVADNCSATGTASYTVNVSNSSTDVSTVLISNFWGLFTNNVTATVDGTNITIANQEPDGDGFTVSGTGTYAAGVMNLSYTVSDGTNSDVCQSTMTKQ